MKADQNPVARDISPDGFDVIARDDRTYIRKCAAGAKAHERTRLSGVDQNARRQRRERHRQIKRCRREVSFVERRQRVNINIPVSEIAPNPAEALVVADHDPLTIVAAIDRQERSIGNQPPNREIGLTGAAAHINILRNDIAANGGWRRRQGGRRNRLRAHGQDDHDVNENCEQQQTCFQDPPRADARDCLPLI